MRRAGRWRKRAKYNGSPFDAFYGADPIHPLIDYRCALHNWQLYALYPKTREAMKTTMLEF